MLWDLLWWFPPALAMSSSFPLSSIQFSAPFPPSGSSFLLHVFACVVFLLPPYVTLYQLMFKLPGVGTIDTTVVIKSVCYSRSMHAVMAHLKGSGEQQRKVFGLRKTPKQRGLQTCMCRPRDVHENALFLSLPLGDTSIPCTKLL